MIDKRFSLYRRMTFSRFIGKGMAALLTALILAGLYARMPAQEPARPIVGEVKAEGEGITSSDLPKATENPDAVASQDNPQKLDLIIGEAVDEFFTDRSQRSEMRMIMHCLAHRENGHAANNHCGDSGKACGPFQFHQETWVRMRSQMIDQGLTKSTGDRYDLKESARTTVWAIKNGRALEWGPIARDAKGSNYAACQKPSWY